MHPPLVEATPRGLACAAGGFHVDPWEPVERAVVTHAHGDHARPGSAAYLCAEPGAALLRSRLGAGATVETLPYGVPLDLGGVRLSFHPAGHVLGSAQVRLEHGGDVWVLSGDYKLAPDPTCAPFEPVRCRVFLTEATFALPVFRWPDAAGVYGDIAAWWRRNAAEGRASILFAYALGKAQRILAALDPAPGPIYVHGAIDALAQVYRAAGIPLASWAHASAAPARAPFGRALVLAPPSAAGTGWLRRFGPQATGFASGWMRIRGPRRRRAVEQGFVLSDHADWPALLAAIEATGAEEVLATHGYAAPLARFLRERGRAASVVETRFEGEAAELIEKKEEAG